MKNKYIYTINDSKNDAVMYVGSSFNPKKRYINHKYCKYNTKKRDWITNNDNYLDIIEDVPLNESDFWESYYICLYKSWGLAELNSEHGAGIGKKIPSNIVSKQKETSLKNGIYDRLSKRNMVKNPMSSNENILKMVLKNRHNGTYNKTKERMLTDVNPGKKQMKPLYQIDNQGNIVREWDCAAHAGKELNLFPENISRACRGIMKTYKGYTWKYKTETECQ